MASAVSVGAIAIVILTRPRAASPERFRAFSLKLGTLSAPAGTFTPYDPSSSSHLGSEPQGSWLPIATDTWSDTEDPSRWMAVRGWELTVPVGQGPAVCRHVLAWLATTGSELGLTTPGQNEDPSACLSALDTVRSNPGNASDALGGRGLQTADGQLRYRIGVETITGTRQGDVLIRVTAAASVANR